MWYEGEAYRLNDVRKLFSGRLKTRFVHKYEFLKSLHVLIGGTG